MSFPRSVRPGVSPALVAGVLLLGELQVFFLQRGNPLHMLVIILFARGDCFEAKNKERLSQ